MPGADHEALLDAALTELDGAIEALLGGSLTDGVPGDAATDGLPETIRAERRLLHAVFQQAPVALFLLEQDGTIRRANNQAAAAARRADRVRDGQAADARSSTCRSGPPCRRSSPPSRGRAGRGGPTAACWRPTGRSTSR